MSSPEQTAAPARPRTPAPSTPDADDSAYLRVIAAGLTGAIPAWRIRQAVPPELPWTAAEPASGTTPSQGWKLHVSATVLCAEEVLARCLPVLRCAGTAFKVAGTPLVLEEVNRGGAGQTQIGKFLTVYPGSDAAAVKLAAALHDATADPRLSGPSVPSDRPFAPDSLVSYRYGAFGDAMVQTAIGELVPALLDPAGEWVPDRRDIAYRQPAWVDDPFPRSATATDAPTDGARLVAGRYLPVASLHWSPRGRVLLAVDLEVGARRVLKTANRAAGVDPTGADACDRLRGEAAMLAKLAPLGRSPEPVDLVVTPDGLCLVMSDLGGRTLEACVLESTSVGGLPTLPDVLSWGSGIAQALAELHHAGYAFGDLKSTNVLVGDDGVVRLVDLEAARPLAGDPGPVPSGTRGYLSLARAAGGGTGAADDMHGLGALLYFLCTGAEPSLAPDPANLLRRPVDRLNPAVPPRLAALVAHCLAPLPPSAGSVRKALSECGADPGPAVPYGQLLGEPAQEEAWQRLASAIGDALCTAARLESDGTPHWSSAHAAGGGGRAQDLNAGGAGAVLALAEIVDALDVPEHRDVLARGARGLLARPRPYGRPLTGLYAGEAGLATALLRAGQALGDDDLIHMAEARGRWIAAQPFLGPDLMTGAAGRLRFCLFLAAATDETGWLDAAAAAADWLVDAAATGPGNVRWIIPAGHDALSGRSFLGYAHGVAGIADALLDCYEATGDERSADLAAAAVSVLERTAVASRTVVGGLDWPEAEGGPPTAALWCRGAGGIARFLAHAATTGVHPAAADLANAAGRSTARGTRWAPAVQCHGLAGNVEVLLDLFRAFGERRHLREAMSLAGVLRTCAVEGPTGPVWPSEDGSTVSPDFLVGYAGVAPCLLRLAAPHRLPHVLTPARFRPCAAVRAPIPVL